MEEKTDDELLVRWHELRDELDRVEPEIKRRKLNFVMRPGYRQKDSATLIQLWLEVVAIDESKATQREMVMKADVARQLAKYGMRHVLENGRKRGGRRYGNPDREVFRTRKGYR